MLDGSMAVHKQWATRKNDERFLNLLDMETHFGKLRDNSKAVVAANRSLRIIPKDDELLIGRGEQEAVINEWAFSQIASLSGAPAGYMRTLPAELAADCLNYGLKYVRDVEEIGLLVSRNGVDNANLSVRAATGPRYGRVWNCDIVRSLVSRFGDGVSGDFRVPGIFGQQVAVTKENTTLYAGERDMFVFLCDEINRVEIKNRRNGKSGSMARGFYVWNSEVGAATLGAAFFLFDYVCGNRIIWGMEEFREMRIRHTVSAPHRWLEEVSPIIDEYRDGSERPVISAIEHAREKRIDDVNEFLANRFGKNMSKVLIERHQKEEDRPIETLWDAVTAATAYARDIPNQDSRVAFERAAGKIMELAQ